MSCWSRPFCLGLAGREVESPLVVHLGFAGASGHRKGLFGASLTYSTVPVKRHPCSFVLIQTRQAGRDGGLPDSCLLYLGPRPLGLDLPEEHRPWNYVHVSLSGACC